MIEAAKISRHELIAMREEDLRVARLTSRTASLYTKDVLNVSARNGWMIPEMVVPVRGCSPIRSTLTNYEPRSASSLYPQFLSRVRFFLKNSKTRSARMHAGGRSGS